MLILLGLAIIPMYAFIPDEITPNEILGNFSRIIVQYMTLMLIPVLGYMYYLEKNMTKLKAFGLSAEHIVEVAEDFCK